MFWNFSYTKDDVALRFVESDKQFLLPNSDFTDFFSVCFAQILYFFLIILISSKLLQVFRYGNQPKYKNTFLIYWSQQINNISLSGFRLQKQVLMSKIVLQKIDCLMDCAADQCCRSVNYKKISTSQNETNCEMLHDIVSHNTFDDMLKKNSAFDYVYLIKPEKVREYTEADGIMLIR